MSEIEKILKACVGAVQTVAEKTGEVIDSLAEKGTPAYEKAVEKGNDVIGKIRDSLRDMDIPSEIDLLTGRIGEFTREQLELLRQKIDEAEEALDRKEQATDAEKEEDVSGPAETEKSGEPEAEADAAEDENEQ